MGIKVSNFCYGNSIDSKMDVLAEVKKLFRLHTCWNKPNYVPVPDNGNCVNSTSMSMFNTTNTVFVSVKSLTPAMLVAFQNCDKMDFRCVIARLNGTVYDYAVNVVKELLLDCDPHVVIQAINIAKDYRLFSMSRLEQNCYVLLQGLFLEDEDIMYCGKVLSEAL